MNIAQKKNQEKNNVCDFNKPYFINKDNKAIVQVKLIKTMYS